MSSRENNLPYEILTLSHFGFKHCSVHCTFGEKVLTLAKSHHSFFKVRGYGIYFNKTNSKISVSENARTLQNDVRMKLGKMTRRMLC